MTKPAHTTRRTYIGDPNAFSDSPSEDSRAQQHQRQTKAGHSSHCLSLASSDDEQIDGTHSLREVPSELVVEGATLTIRVDPTEIPLDLRGSDGVVDFSVFVEDVYGRSYTTFLSARGGAIPSNVGSARATTTDSRYDHLWVSPIETEEDVSRKRAPSGFPILKPSASDEEGSAGRSATMAQDAYDYDDETIDINPHQFAEADIPSAPAAGGNDCLKETYTGDTNRSTTIGTSYPIGATVSKMEHTNSSSNSSSLGVAVGSENDSGTVQWKQSGTRTVGGSWTGLWEYTGTKRSYRIQTNYHKYVLGKGCNGSVHYRRPHIETGGAATNTNGLTRPAWNEFCARQPKVFTFIREDSQGYAYSYGAAVKFASAIGIDLSIKKNYNTKNRLFYRFSGDVQHKLCGKDDYPSMASKMIDRFAD